VYPRPPHFSPPHAGTLPTELRVAHNEYEWLVGTQTMHTLERIDAIARECCRRLPLPSMLGKYGAAGAKTSINHPEKFTLVGAGASESTTNAATAIRATLTLMGDNVVQADVAIRCLCVCACTRTAVQVHQGARAHVSCRCSTACTMEATTNPRRCELHS
jgi:hypothetical protein